jgi:hypothetical protein
MLDGPFKAAMGISAYVLIVFVKAFELGLGGAITLADVCAPAVVILCEPCGRGALQCGAAHRQVWRRVPGADDATAPAAPGRSGNPRSRPRKWARVPQDGFADAIRIRLDITPAGAAELCRRGLITPGYETHPQAVAYGISRLRRGT